MKTILTKKNEPILVDNNKYEYLNQFRWHLSVGYAETWISGKKVFMHRVLLGLVKGDGYIVDHKNGIRTDNRLENLRLCTTGQNKRNSKVHRNNKLGVKGVRLIPSGKFQALIKINEKQIQLGIFTTIEEAIQARKIFGQKLHGEFFRQD